MSSRKTQQGICAAAAVLAVIGHGGAASLYVNGGCGNDGWTGASPVCVAPNGPKATIQAAIDSTFDGDEVIVADGVYTGPGNREMSFGGRHIVLRSENGPAGCTIDCQGAGRAFIIGSGGTDDPVIQGLTMANGSAFFGGAVQIDEASASFSDCIFTDNSADIGGAIHNVSPMGKQLTLLRCVFDGNLAYLATGAVFCSMWPAAAAELTAVDCVFTDNDGGQGPGALGAISSEARYANCLFAGNSAQFVGGGLADASDFMLLANCVFSRNSAGMAGGLEAGNSVAVITNCTFSLNEGEGIGSVVNAVLSNCILWGNVPAQIAELSAVVEHSDVQGGWAGTGNIDVDPMFVQPGTDDVRLAFGSPCVDAGNNASLPPDDLDLDGDGNTTEPIPYDLGGNARVQGGTVDMGAWEGEFESGAPASGDNDLDQGEFVALVPEGGQFNPVQSPAVIVTNTSGPDNASFLVTQLEQAIHPGAGGFSELSAILRTETSLADGQYFATVYISFDAGDLAGSMAQQLSLTHFDEAAGNWAFASSANSQPSPGFTGPIGNRIVELQGGAWGITQQLGDYGVFWDPQLQQGFVWANVDHQADFGVGFAFCPSDCLQTPDGLIGIQDMLTLLSLWGVEAGGGPCDANFDGVIDQVDFGALLTAWGPCEVPSSAPPRGAPPTPALATRSADLDGDGVVGRNDLLAMKASWGDCEGDCPGDLNVDGRVDITDWLSMLAQWTRR